MISGGMQFNEAAGSTIGILMFSAMREAGKVAGDRERLGPADLTDMLEAAIGGIAKRGKAEVGQKTILDSLAPALQTMRRGVAEGQDAATVFRAAARSAAEGAEATRQMQPGVGRARWFAERSTGEIDPGAVSGSVIIGEIAAYWENS